MCGRVGGRAAGPSPGRPSLGLVTVGPVWAGAPPPTVPACRLESPTAPTMHAGRGQGGRRACATAPVPATYITTLNVPVRHAWNRPSWTTRVTGVGLRVSTWLRRGAGEGGGCYGVGVCVWGDPDRADAGAGAARGVQVHNMACTTAPGGALGHPRRGPLHCVPRTAQTRAHTCRPTHPPWVDGVPARVAHLHRDPAQPVPPQGSRPRGLTEPLWGRPDPRSWRCASCWEVPGQGQPGQGCRQGPPSPSLGGAGARGAHPSPPRRRRPSAG